ncbi:MAG: hypothetical protein ACYDHG_17155 [Desulfomonilaceae bacterium]
MITLEYAPPLALVANVYEPMAGPWVALGIGYFIRGFTFQWLCHGWFCYCICILPTVEPWAHECCPCGGKYD